MPSSTHRRASEDAALSRDNAAENHEWTRGGDVSSPQPTGDLLGFYVTSAREVELLGSWYSPITFPPGSRNLAVISGASPPMGCTIYGVMTARKNCEGR